MRGLTILGTSDARPCEPGRVQLFFALAVAMPRYVPKEMLTQVPLRDLQLDRQYEEIRRDLERYREPTFAVPQEGEHQCGGCGAIQLEETPRCDCGTFLHSHRVFTCPGCAEIVPKDARDCNRCGSSFWSPVNPPERELTETMVDKYLQQYERSDDA
jgi:hypothetical protein